MFLCSTLITFASIISSTLAASVCYDDLGCFTNEGVYDNAPKHLPRSPDIIDAKFLLYTRQDKYDSVEIDYTNISTLIDSTFNSSLGTKFIIHGFMSDADHKKWIPNMKNALLKQGDYNVIIVDWRNGAKNMNYLQAVMDLRVVAAQMAKTIEIMETHGLDSDNVHLIGFSLGAQMAGFAGRLLKGRIGRISGLEPAGPSFQTHDKEVRLDKDDAQFVDVIHTNGEKFSFGGLGTSIPSGDVDFYLNDGKYQPGCASWYKAAFSTALKYVANKIVDVFDVDGFKDVVCNHRRAHLFFIETILGSPELYTAIPCDSYEDFMAGKCTSCGLEGCNRAGFFATPNKSLGKQFLLTTEYRPYRLDNGYLVKVYFGWHVLPTYFKGSVQVSLTGENGTSNYGNVNTGTVLRFSGGSIKRIINLNIDVGRILSANVRVIPSDPDSNDKSVTVKRVTAKSIPDGEEFISETKARKIYAHQSTSFSTPKYQPINYDHSSILT